MRNVIYFHNPDEGNGYLSNWYLSDFVIEDIKFTSMEQYMMYSKAVTFMDSETAERILASDNVGEIKALGRQVKNYNDTIWNGIRQIVVYNGLVAKFEQNAQLRDLLLATEDSILAECAVQDRIWGIGLSMHDENRFDMGKCRGQNLLGFSLMQVREYLRKSYS